MLCETVPHFRRRWQVPTSQTSDPLALSQHSHSALFGFDNLLGQLTELKKALYSLLAVIIKDTVQEQPNRREAEGRVPGQGRGAAMLSLGAPPSHISVCLSSWKAATSGVLIHPLMPAKLQGSQSQLQPLVLGYPPHVHL